MNPSKKQVTAFAPATVANVACGFDVMGFALQQPGDVVTVKKSERPGVVITQISGDGGKLPRQADQNTAGVAVSAFLEALQIDAGVEMELHKQTPLSSGLGSSAASPAAAVWAVNALFDYPLRREALLPFAVKGESIASGAVHADNVAPALLGGIVLIRGYNPLDIVNLNVPQELYCAVIHPHIGIPTREARKLLPENIALKDAVAQWGNLGGLVAGLQMGDYDLISRSLQDVVAEPVRSRLIPGFQEMKLAALNAGALGCSISGSGPAVFALCKGETIARQTGQAMRFILEALQIRNTLYISAINRQGARVMED
jgi:homoserine kinase